VKHELLELRQAELRAQLAREIAPATTVRGATAAGDTRKLRGIPVAGVRGAGVAIPGTRPTDALHRLD
jgi:hypothetical protein